MHIQSLPLEILTEISIGLVEFNDSSEYLTEASLADIKSARAVSHLFRAASNPAFAEACFVFYPTRRSMRELLRLTSDAKLVPYIRKLKLVGVTFRQPSLVDADLWLEAAAQCGVAWYSYSRDRECMKAVMAWRGAALAQQGNYTTLGQFRTDLTQALHNLHRLKLIRLDRDLAPGQHLPGWSGPDLLPRLTGWHDSIDLREIFYGDYLYRDTIGRRCQFLEDVFAAVQAGAGGRKVKVVISSIPGRPLPLRANVRGVADIDAAWRQDIDVEEE